MVIGVGMGIVEIVKELVMLWEIYIEFGLIGLFKDELIVRWI